MSVDPIPSPARFGAFVHPLLRARDWQDRPEFGELCQWWKDGGVGVCALVGIGGAGKTAIAERFLQVLPGGYPEHPKVPKNRSLSAPARLFVFSFYNAPNPDTFFNELAAWLQDRKATEPTRLPSYQQILELLAMAGHCLLVLDGLEKVQDDGSRGGVLGQMLDGRLRDLVLRVADALLPQVWLLITSRFRLFDPLAARTDYYQQIEVEQLQASTAVQLLRDRGVRGRDTQLEYVAREQGFHALSVDLVGGYIALFCEGDFELFASLPQTKLEPTAGADPVLDPRIAALRDQERRFARLAEHYHEALARSDPATLALLQRICLFRLGVEASALVSIFTGEGKERISGQALAHLNDQELESKLQLLVEMRLVEASKPHTLAQRTQTYTVHPAVRSSFLRTLDINTARLGHDAACEKLEESLGGQPSENPSDPVTLDLLEEIVYHTLAAGHVQKAWDIYGNRMGEYRNLGRRLGAYERGERICRIFASGQSPQKAPLPTDLSEIDQAKFLNEWALYLKHLGQLAAAGRCYERALEMLEETKDWANASIGYQNLLNVLVLAGRSTAAFKAAEAALQLTMRAKDVAGLPGSHSYRASVYTLRGEINRALADFSDARRYQQKIGGDPEQSLWGHSGIFLSDLLLRLGASGRAEQLAQRSREIIRSSLAEERDQLRCSLLLAELKREHGDLEGARFLQYEAHEWALQHDAKELFCWSSLVRAKIELSALELERQASLLPAASALEDGLRIACECGYGIYHIDLLLVRAQLALHEGRAADAARDVRVALDEGVHPPAESGFPELLAATDPECLYAWGIAEGRQLLAEALLLQAAQMLGQAEFVPKRFDRLPADVRDLIGRASKQLDQALELWRKLRDPESETEINPKGEQTKHVLEGLSGGILTEYPLEPVQPEQPAAIQVPPEPPIATIVAPEPVRGTKIVPRKKHLFLSYCHDNRAEVSKLHDELIVAGEAVWWDQVILGGQDWKHEIRKAMRDAYAVVLCLSRETADRITSGVYPEVLDAIAAYREYAPGSIFLIPVRLSDCEIPLIEIDGTRALDRLQYVDLFPSSQRASGLQQLVKALKAAPLHP